jgi:hypothetical protein
MKKVTGSLHVVKPNIQVGKKILHDVDIVEKEIRKYFSWDKADTYLMVHADTLKIIITEIIKKL